jgi:hypothetical protein
MCMQQHYGNSNSSTSTSQCGFNSRSARAAVQLAHCMPPLRHAATPCHMPCCKHALCLMCLSVACAGYKGGAQMPPGASTLRATVDITQFGARPDGVSDTTRAIKAAVASKACRGAAQCVVYIPPGRFAMKQQLNITDPVIVRGAGRDRTTLYFPYSLSEVKQDFSGNPWFMERLLQFIGSSEPVYSGKGATKLASISRLSRRGSSRVYVDKPRAIRKGQQVRVVASDYGEDGEDCHSSLGWQQLLSAMAAALTAPGCGTSAEATGSSLKLFVPFRCSTAAAVAACANSSSSIGCGLLQWRRSAGASPTCFVVASPPATSLCAAVLRRNPCRPQHHTAAVLPSW